MNDNIFALKSGAKLKDIYTINKLIGRGGSSFVYLAEKKIGTSKNKVLIKELCPKYMSDSLHRDETNIYSTSLDFKLFLENMKKEQAFHLALKKDGNPHIFDLHDIFNENNTEYIVTSYEQGDMLRSLFKDKPSPFDIVTYIIAILNALASLHQKGILHLDITPDNIFISKQKINGINLVKLIDFNNCIALDKPIKYDNLLVNPSYASLELKILSEYGKTDSYDLIYSSDLYSVCSIFYEMVTGTPPANIPFPINSDFYEAIENLNMHDLAKKICAGILTKGLLSDASMRYQNVNELLDDLHKLYNLLKQDTFLPVSYNPTKNTSFCGRDRELKALCSSLFSHRKAFISGDNFIGKSALIDEFCSCNDTYFDIICKLKFYKDIKHTIAASGWSNILNEEKMNIEELYTFKMSLFMNIKLKTLLVIEDIYYDENIYDCLRELSGNPSLCVIASTRFSDIFPNAIMLKPLGKSYVNEIKKDCTYISQKLLDSIDYSPYVLSLIMQKLDLVSDKEYFINKLTDDIVSLKNHDAYDEEAVTQLILSQSLIGLSEKEVINKAYNLCVSVFDLNALFDATETDCALYDIVMLYKKEYGSVYNKAYAKILNDSLDMIKNNRFKNNVNLLKISDMVNHIADIANLGGANYLVQIQKINLTIYTHLRNDLYSRLHRTLYKSRSYENVNEIYEQYKYIIMCDINLALGENELVNSSDFYNLLSDFKNFCLRHFGYNDKRTLYSKLLFSEYISGSNSLYSKIMIREAKNK